MPLGHVFPEAVTTQDHSPLKAPQGQRSPPPPATGSLASGAASPSGNGEGTETRTGVPCLPFLSWNSLLQDSIGHQRSSLTQRGEDIPSLIALQVGADTVVVVVLEVRAGRLNTWVGQLCSSLQPRCRVLGTGSCPSHSLRCMSWARSSRCGAFWFPRL